MKRGALCALLLLAGCGDPAPPPEEPSAETAQSPAPAEPTHLVTMEATEFYLYDTRAGAGAVDRPLVTIKAESVQLGAEVEERFSFERASAILRSDDPDEEEIVFEAEQGHYIEGERATLSGGVRASIGDLTLELEDVEFVMPSDENSESVCFTNKPVRITGPQLEFEADGLRLYPETKQFELESAAGSMQFEGSLI